MRQFKWRDALMEASIAIEADPNRTTREKDVSLIFSTPNPVTYGDMFAAEIDSNPNPYSALLAEVDTTPQALKIVARKVKANTGKRLRDWTWDDIVTYLKENWMDIAKTVASILVLFI